MERQGTAGQATDENIIRLMRFACWINKATHTVFLSVTEYVILTAFSRQQLSRERASMLSYTYILSLVITVCCDV